MTHPNPEISAAAPARDGAAVPRYLIAFFGALVALGPLSMDAYLPAIPLIAADFGVGVVQVNNTLSIFLIGYAIGQFLGGSFSDQIGRKRIGYIGLTVYVGTTLAMAFVDTVEHMLVLRFFQAIGGGFSTVICMASVRDIYPLEELGRRFATVTMIVLVAPLIAPTIGSLLLPLGWHSIFLLKAVYAVVLFVLYTLIVPETRPGAWARLSLWSLARQSSQVLMRRVGGRLVPLRYACAMALSASVLMVFVTNAAFVYMEYFSVSATVFPLIFALSVLGFMSMNLFSMRRLTSGNAGTFFRSGLRIQIAAIVLLLLVVRGGAAELWNVVPLIVLMMSTLGLVGPAGSARYMGYFAELAGSASSVYTTLMFALGGALGALVGVLYDGTLLPMIGIMAVASTIANVIVLTIPQDADC